MSRLPDFPGFDQLNDYSKQMLVYVDDFTTTFEANPPWDTLILEEADEVDEAAAAYIQASANLLKELIDLDYVRHGSALADPSQTYEFPLIERLNSYDPLYSLFAPLLAKAAAEVHRSNMSKLGEDGKPIRREDGKILKGPNYSPADMASIILGKEI